jgi:hypothetical protein
MPGQKKRIDLNFQVSTSKQAIDNKRIDLNRAGTQCGWKVVEVYGDHGINGTKARNQRPALSCYCLDISLTVDYLWKLFHYMIRL